VKECGTENCNWLFLDTSKNRSRRWCDMKECGNREKARRHYHRKKGVQG
jgi:predicted RNA-binding Zn ribbon-like protein